MSQPPQLTKTQWRKLQALYGCKLLILGAGREGLSTYRFLRSIFPERHLTIADSNLLLPKSEPWRDIFAHDYLLTHQCGVDYLKNLESYDVIFKTPGLPFTTPAVSLAREHGVRFTSNIEWFLRLARGTIIGVTGTKGKSTTSSLIAHVLRESGLPTLLLGNIGVAPLSAVTQTAPKSYTILEMSAHQLQDLTISPHWAVVQNITSEHLDYYPNTTAYVQAKSSIVRFQKKNDFYVYSDEFATSRDFASLTPATQLSYGLKRTPTHHCFIKGYALFYQNGEHPVSVVNLHKTKLLGKHNYYNIMPAVIIAEHLGISNEQIERAIYSFTPLRHRLEYITTVNHVNYYNDSLSTTPEATNAALHAFADKPIHLFAGGHERYQDYSQVAKTILKNNIRTVFLFPTTGVRLKKEIIDLASKKQLSMPKFFDVASLSEAVNQVHVIAKPGDTVLLSPGAASFGQFKNYADRGDQFCQLVKNLL